jgi:nicotinamidase-related amidase
LLQREDAVLVVIDVQERLLPHVVGGGEVVANIVKLLRFAGIVGLPVVLTEQLKLGPTVDEIKRELPSTTPVVKTEFGCLACERFAEVLGGSGRKVLVLVGLEAHICVAQTALQAISEYGVQVVGDAVSSRSLADKETALRRMVQSGVIVTTAEMLMYEILARAGTDEFRAVLELVKAG